MMKFTKNVRKVITEPVEISFDEFCNEIFNSIKSDLDYEDIARFDRVSLDYDLKYYFEDNDIDKSSISKEDYDKICERVLSLMHEYKNKQCKEELNLISSKEKIIDVINTYICENYDTVLGFTLTAEEILNKIIETCTNNKN